MANTIFQLLSEFFARYGYWVVFFGVMLENVGLPVPGETVLLFAGFLAYQGKLHILPAILTGYWSGHRRGRSRLCAWVLRSHHGRLSDPGALSRLAKQYDKSRELFQKHGHWAVFAARFITGVRVFAGILAGVLRMRFVTFLVYSFAGAVCWGIVIGLVGFLFGGSWDTLVRIVGRMNRIAVIVIVASAAVLFLVHVVRRRRLS